MAAGTMQLYHRFFQGLADNALNLGVNDLKVALFTDTYVPDLSTDVTFSALTGQVASGSGYVSGGATLTYLGVTRLTLVAGVATLRADNVVWTASGGSIIARYAVLYDSSVTTNNLIGYILLDATPANVEVTDTNDLTLEWHTDGVLSIALGA